LAIGSIYIGSRQTYRMQEDNARLQETGRYALEVVGRSVRQAGFWNMPISPVDTATAFSGTPITGVNAASPTPDTVTVQYDGLTGDRDCEGTVLAANAVIAEAYSLNGSNLVCDGNDALAAASPLVSDIEDVQILYGIYDPAANDQSVRQYVAAPTAAEWPNVVSARVCVQARSANNVNNAPQRFLNCAGALGTAANAAAASTTAGANDFRLRRTFIATYNLRNRVTNVP
jgi:type IV pilus assembly protein PilW